MTVTVNGTAREVPQAHSVAALVADLGRDPDRPGVAVAVNGEVVARRVWAGQPLADGDHVEVLVAAQGG